MFRSPAFLFALAIVAAIYGFRWHQTERVAQYSDPIVKLLDDSSNPFDQGFSGRSARLCKVMAILAEAKQESHLTAGVVIRRAAEELNMTDEVTNLLVDAIDTNLTRAQSTGLLEGENLIAMKMGELPLITKGPFIGGSIEFEFDIPIESAPMLEHQFANLVLQPTFLTQQGGVPFTRKSRAKADHFYRANLITQDGYMQLASNATSGPSW